MTDTDPLLAAVEAFHRDYPNARTNCGDVEERNFWKYVPEFVARARAAASLRILQRRLTQPVEATFTTVLNALHPKETR